MRMNKGLSADPHFNYFVSSENPKLLIHSGTHGDEGGVIQHVKAALEKYESLLPSFVFVPEVSPSAVKLKTRVNSKGNDLNRVFLSNSEDEEVRLNIEVIKDKKFDLFVSFHEDPEYSDYYVYDFGYGEEKNKLVLEHNEFLKKQGVGLLNGVDDPTDPKLGYKFVDGYNKFAYVKKDVDSGNIAAWVLNRDIAKNCLFLEIPGKADYQTKEIIVDSFFREVILRSFESSIG